MARNASIADREKVALPADPADPEDFDVSEAGVEQALAQRRARGRPRLPASARKQAVNIRLSPDVLAALRASGRGWQARVDDLLRKGLHLEK